ncbi:hypothetical protein HYH02_008749 [Chlamydomonas schloesseri]|uniref:NADH:ubiquinone oxidoreductase intermediate-associated protein 30 domain-containing protein n=1 Tax=Chlamydomonas schloesseri TaxID=2026947 RepID=A0A836B249_9CHLO|nr:hypothetical protein HYH02_008749 [Chlamydomonas schloesseri]|eukprot:KAG2445282.1 hypothetical protein HYH02_008749 [Chlamydomonas schloesseri]
MLNSRVVSRVPTASTGRSVRGAAPRVPTSITSSARLVAASASLTDALASVPPEAIAAGGVTLAGLLGLVYTQMNPAAPGEEGVAVEQAAVGVEAEAEAVPPPPRENAVLVLGATGRLGRRTVAKLLASGRTVVAAARSLDKARDVLLGSGEGKMGLSEGRQAGGRPGILFLEEFDITSADSLKRPGLWAGVSQVVLTVGTVFGPLPEGGFGVIGGMTSEVVEAQGIARLMEVLPELLPKKTQRTSRLVLPMRTAEELAVWNKLDDVIMGGASDSGLEPITEAEREALGAADGGCVWRGKLIVEGGGFCGTRTNKLGLNLGDADGIHMRVLGDGQTFKMNIKTIDQEDVPESTYQTTFDTVAGQWHDVYLPWHNFVSVKRAQSDPEGVPLDPSRISKLGLVLSRFEFNKAPNPDYKPGPFALLLAGGISTYTDVRPQVVMISSAGVERNAIIGDDEVKRMQDIPIVQLNPNGTLNHKYTAEIAVRSSGYPYSVVRSTGMIDSMEGGPFLPDADQGDVIIGQISREEVAECLAMAANMPESAYKTFELRRNEGPESKGKRPPTTRDFQRLFLKLSQDKYRWRVGLQPMPKAVPPPPPVTEERRAQIVAQVAVIRGQAPPAAPAPGDGANGSAAIAEKKTEQVEKKEPVTANA